MLEHERALGEQFLDGLPAALDAARRPDDGRPRADVRDHARVASRRRRRRERLGERGFAVWHGNYYAVEIMQRLGLDDGAVRVGIVHYNTADEVDGACSARSAAI